MNMELLFFDRCPHYEALISHLRGILKRERIEVALELVRVETPQEAEELRFLGSPTVRVEGRDVETAAAHRHDFGLKCRIYQTPEGLKGAPPDDWILATIRSSQHA